MGECKTGQEPLQPEEARREAELRSEMRPVSSQSSFGLEPGIEPNPAPPPLPRTTPLCVTGTASAPRFNLSHHIISAFASAVVLRFDCTVTHGHCGYAQPLTQDGLSGGDKIFRMGGGLWTADDGACHHLDPRLSSRLEAACGSTRSPRTFNDWLGYEAPAHDLCLNGGAGVVPVAHSHSLNFGGGVGTINQSCVFERHRALYGEAFLPVGCGRETTCQVAPQGSSYSVDGATGVERMWKRFGQAQLESQDESLHQTVEEVQGCDEAGRFLERLYAHRPAVYRGCASSSPSFRLWTDDYLATSAPEYYGHEVYAHHSGYPPNKRLEAHASRTTRSAAALPPRAWPRCPPWCPSLSVRHPTSLLAAQVPQGGPAYEAVRL
jgi:hypothetical protein